MRHPLSGNVGIDTGDGSSAADAVAEPRHHRAVRVFLSNSGFDASLPRRCDVCFFRARDHEGVHVLSHADGLWRSYRDNLAMSRGVWTV